MEPGSPTLALGERLQLTVSVVGPTGAPVPNSLVHYSSSNPSVVSVTSQGMLTAFQPGTAYVEVRADRGYAIVPVDVERVVHQIEIRGPSRIVVGSSAGMDFLPLDLHGAGVAAAVTIQSSDESVALVRRVANDWHPHEIVGLAEGEVVITATSGSVTATATVTVTR